MSTLSAYHQAWLSYIPDRAFEFLEKVSPESSSWSEEAMHHINLALDKIIHQCRKAWPQIHVPEYDFFTYLAQRVSSSELLESLEKLAITDLYSMGVKVVVAL